MIFQTIRSALMLFLIGAVGCFILDLFFGVFNPKAFMFRYSMAVYENLSLYLLICLAVAAAGSLVVHYLHAPGD